MKATRKYKLVPPHRGFSGIFQPEFCEESGLAIQRIKALRDIPEIGVKKGDLGGYVTYDEVLSHEDSSWICPNAKVFGPVKISGNVSIDGNAFILCVPAAKRIKISGNIRISGNAKIILDHDAIQNTVISGNVFIANKVELRNVGKINGDINILGNAELNRVAEIAGTVNISGRAVIGQGVTLRGENSRTYTAISGSVILEKESTVINSILSGAFTLGDGETLKDILIDETGCYIKGVKVLPGDITGISPNAVIESTKARPSSNPIEAPRTFEEILTHIGSFSVEDLHKDYVRQLERKAPVTVPALEVSEKQAGINDALLLLAEVNAKNNAYETDIVKMIRYPAMADKGYDTTADLYTALSRANRMALNPTQAGFVDVVTNAEKAFIRAESYALKMAASVFTEDETKKVSKAKDLLAIASNEASTDHEKKVAFQQAFKQLEGVIAVPEIAVETFRVKIGLKEIEGTIKKAGF
jgi:carbonic anhydrase/acetyltransferase-like protein (isoleucine patch superfamily)